jgi:hypothetical protein
MIIVLAPLLVLAPLTAWAAGTDATAAAAFTGTSWSRSWSPPMSLLVQGSTEQYKSLSSSFDGGAQQKATLTVRFKTDWDDARAVTDSPNIVQQGLYAQASQVKVQIQHGSTPVSHRAQCRIAGTTGSAMATGPAIDVADGAWHTVTCVKSADGASRTKVVVIVDGQAGTAAYSTTPIGNLEPAGVVRLGGRSSTASTDSLDGWISRLAWRLA